MYYTVQFLLVQFLLNSIRIINAFQTKWKGSIASISTQESIQELQRKYDNLIEWAKENGSTISSDVIPIVRDSSKGCGLFAKNTIKKNEEVICLSPFDNTRFDIETILPTLDAGPLKDMLVQLSNGNKDNKMASLAGCLAQLHLLRCTSEVTDSKYGAYLDILDITPLSSHMIFWTEEEISLLLGTIAHSDAVAMRSAVKKLIEYLSSSFMEQNSRTVEHLTNELVEDLLKGSFACLTSRCFKGSTSFNLLPVIDLVNHDADCSNVECSIYSNGTAILRATEDIEEGEELLLNYGDKPSWEFAIEYGFCPESIKCDGSGIPLVPSSISDDIEMKVLKHMFTVEQSKEHKGSMTKLLPLNHEIDGMWHSTPCVSVRTDTDVTHLLQIFIESSSVLYHNDANNKIDKDSGMKLLRYGIDSRTRMLKSIDKKLDSMNHSSFKKQIVKQLRDAEMIVLNTLLDRLIDSTRPTS